MSDLGKWLKKTKQKIEKYRAIIDIATFFVAFIALILSLANHFYPSVQSVNVTSPVYIKPTYEEQANFAFTSVQDSLIVEGVRKEAYDKNGTSYPNACKNTFGRIENILRNMSLEKNKNNFERVIDLKNETVPLFDFLSKNCWPEASSLVLTTTIAVTSLTTTTVPVTPPVLPPTTIFIVIGILLIAIVAIFFVRDFKKSLNDN